MRFLKMYQVEQKLFLRTPDVIVFNLAMPLVTLILITIIAGNKAAADSGLTFLQRIYEHTYFHSGIPVSGSIEADVLQPVLTGQTSGLRYHSQRCNGCNLNHYINCSRRCLFRLQNVMQYFRICGSMVSYDDFHVFHRTSGRLSLQNGKKSEHCHFHFILSYAILFWGNHS